MQAPLFHSLPWILLGDFNVVRFRYEREGGSSDWPSFMSDFDEVICSAGLEDLRFSGGLFTWHNGRMQGHILSKLDRALVNATWLSSFEASCVEFLPFGVSDHSPVVVDIGVQIPKVRRPFKFFNHWVEFEDFFPLVEAVWRMEVDGYAMFKLYKKLKVLKVALKDLAFKKAKRCNVLEVELRSKLSSIQSRIASGGVAEDLLEQERSCLAQFLQVTRDAECSIKQKSRVQWLKEGDCNSSFFF